MPPPRALSSVLHAQLAVAADRHARRQTVVEAPPPIAVSASLAEKKMAYLMLSVTRNSDLVYTERFEKAGKKGLKIESPGIMVIEAVFDGDYLQISPKDFGGTDTATKIKTEFESLVKRL